MKQISQSITEKNTYIFRQIEYSLKSMFLLFTGNSRSNIVRVSFTYGSVGSNSAFCTLYLGCGFDCHPG